jgi:hypothetical protein
VIVAVVSDATAVVATVKVPVVAPAATVTLAGTVADALLLDRVTTAPPVGAAALKVTVPVELAPPTRLAGASATDVTVTAGGLIVSEAVWLEALYVAVMTALVTDATAVVVTVNVPVVEPAATVTLAGTVADALLLERLTSAPPVGAVALTVTVPVELAPPTRLVGARATDVMVTAGGLMLSEAVWLEALYVAVMTALVTDATAVVVTVNVPVVAPAATVTLAGTVADALLLDRVTTAPPVGATELSVTVPVELAPPTRLVGTRATDVTVTAGGLIVSEAVWLEAL